MIDFGLEILQFSILRCHYAKSINNKLKFLNLNFKQLSRIYLGFSQSQAITTAGAK